MYEIKPRVLAASLILLVVSLGFWHAWPNGSNSVPVSHARSVFTSHSLQGISYMLYVPSSLPADKPATVLVAIHGMNGQPDTFAGPLVDAAEQNGWVIVAPHLPYGDCMDPNAVKAEEKKNMAWLDALLTSLPGETSLNLKDRALIYGFSRGGQVAHRFALAYPNRILAAAIMSPGSYTLPLKSSAAFDNRAPLNFPVGVSDIDGYGGRAFDVEAVKRVRFWVGVGEQDNHPNDVPRLWDRYLGATRLDRARSFANLLSGIGAQVTLNVFPGIGHTESPDSRRSAVSFLRASELAAQQEALQLQQLSVPPDAQPTLDDQSASSDSLTADRVPRGLESYALA